MGFGPLGEKRKFTLVQQFTVIKLKKHKRLAWHITVLGLFISSWHWLGNPGSHDILSSAHMGSFNRVTEIGDTINLAWSLTVKPEENFLLLESKKHLKILNVSHCISKIHLFISSLVTGLEGWCHKNFQLASRDLSNRTRQHSHITNSTILENI